MLTLPLAYRGTAFQSRILIHFLCSEDYVRALAPASANRLAERVGYVEAADWRTMLNGKIR